MIRRACELISTHLERIWRRKGDMPLNGPLQSMLIDLLHGIRLSEELITERIEALPHLKGKLMQIFYAEDKLGFDTLTTKLSHFFNTNNFKCGVSNHFRSISDLRGYYEQAAAALQSATTEGLYFYRDIMLSFKLLERDPH